MMSMMMGGARYGLGGASVMTSQGMTSSLSPDPPSPTHSSDSSCSNIPPTSPSGQSRGMSKECGVCGDVAKSMHFGGLSCDSCKAFFRRSVQNNAYKGFSCPYDKNCVIGVSSRKACQYCRFEKCISIGMEKGWVMSEDERKKMMEQRKERKSKQGSEGAPKSSDSGMYTLSEEDRNEIALIVAMYKKAYDTIPYEESAEGEGGPSWPPAAASAAAAAAGDAGLSSNGTNVMGPYITFCQRILYFFSLFRDFSELSVNDQSLLLRTALTSSGIIMGSVVYDSNSGKWAAKINHTWAKNIPNISSQSVEKLVPTDLITRVDKFFKKFQQICPDETMAMILILVALYSPELMGLEARERVQILQDRYIHILQNYVKYKFKEKSSIMFPKAIVSLADIRELADRTGQMRLQGNSTNFLSGMMPSMSSAALGSPYAGLAFSSQIPSHRNATGGELVPTTNAPHHGPKNDPTYQRIMNVFNQVYASINGRQHLLPVILQLLKKCALANVERKSGTKASSGSQRRTSRHSRNKAHRVSMTNKSRVPSLKRELSTEHMSLTIKEEVMDHSEDTLLSFNSDVSHPYNPETSYGGGVSPQGMMTSFPHPQHQQSPFDQVHGANIGHSSPSSSSSLTLSSSGPLYHHQQPPQHHHQHISDLSPQPPDHHFMASSSQSSFGGDDSTLTYPSAMSPESDFHGYSPTQIPLNSHIQVGGSPHMPPVSPFPSPHPIPSSPLNNAQSFSPVGPSLSPPSSADSSSSQEDLEIPKGEKEILPQNFTDTEVEVLMQLLDHMSNYDILDKNKITSLSNTDILPIPLLRELQSKLHPNNALGAASPELAMEVTPLQRDFVASHIPQPPPQPNPSHLVMGTCMEIGSEAMEVINQGMGIGASPLEMCSDTMDVVSTSLDRGT